MQIQQQDRRRSKEDRELYNNMRVFLQVYQPRKEYPYYFKQKYQKSLDNRQYMTNFSKVLFMSDNYEEELSNCRNGEVVE